MRKLASTLNIIIISILFLSFAFQTGAQEDELPEDIATRLQLRYDGINSLLFNFFQVTSGELTGRPRKGSGKAMFYKKDNLGKMRWDYVSPEKQVLVSDGVHFSMYFSDLQQMIVSPAETLDSDLTYSFFTGSGNLIRDFHIRPANEEFQLEDATGFKIVKLIPRTPQSQVQDIHLWVTTDSLIQRITIRDHFGTVTVLNFNDIVVDSLIGTPPSELESLFTFEPPMGTEIIKQ